MCISQFSSLVSRKKSSPRDKPQRVRGPAIQWSAETLFNTADEAKAFITRDNKWKFRYSHQTTEGKKVFTHSFISLFDTPFKQFLVNCSVYFLSLTDDNIFFWYLVWLFCAITVYPLHKYCFSDSMRFLHMKSDTRPYNNANTSPSGILPVYSTS